MAPPSQKPRRIKRYILAAAILSLLIGVCCIPPVKRAIAVAIFSSFDPYQALVPRVGTTEEFTIDDTDFDVLIYYFDGGKGKRPVEVATEGLKTIRENGFRHTKKLFLVIFCNLTSTNKSNKIVYPYGLLLESAAIRNPTDSIKDLTTKTFIETPLDFDYRVGDSFYRTNNLSETWAQISENTNYIRPITGLENGWIMSLRDLTNKTEVYAKFGLPKYYVRERGTYSEVYPVDEGDQAGGVRVWYDGDKVRKTGCIMTNK